jgi:hypothetical protein
LSVTRVSFCATVEGKTVNWVIGLKVMEGDGKVEEGGDYGFEVDQWFHLFIIFV